MFIKTPKVIKIQYFQYLFTPEGNFDIDAGDGGGGAAGDHLGPPKSTQILTNSSCENCSNFWDIFRKAKNTPLYNIFLYTENDSESDTRI